MITPVPPLCFAKATIVTYQQMHTEAQNSHKIATNSFKYLLQQKLEWNFILMIFQGFFFSLEFKGQKQAINFMYSVESTYNNI